jgi:hypothetical protein
LCLFVLKACYHFSISMSFGQYYFERLLMYDLQLLYTTVVY